jgi:hypothetical protein
MHADTTARCQESMQRFRRFCAGVSIVMSVCGIVAVTTFICLTSHVMN